MLVVDQVVLLVVPLSPYTTLSLLLPLSFTSEEAWTKLSGQNHSFFFSLSLALSTFISVPLYLSVHSLSLSLPVFLSSATDMSSSLSPYAS